MRISSSNRGIHHGNARDRNDPVVFMNTPNECTPFLYRRPTISYKSSSVASAARHYPITTGASSETACSTILSMPLLYAAELLLTFRRSRLRCDFQLDRLSDSGIVFGQYAALAGIVEPCLICRT